MRRAEKAEVLGLVRRASRALSVVASSVREAASRRCAGEDEPAARSSVESSVSAVAVRRGETKATTERLIRVQARLGRIVMPPHGVSHP